ncbi:hypothetical protein ACFY36_30830 [Actinoplanes sp. NPDC000266]
MAVAVAGVSAPATALMFEPPFWALILVAPPVAIGSVVAALGAAMVPQESGDRLEWWREWLRHRERMADRT